MTVYRVTIFRNRAPWFHRTASDRAVADKIYAAELHDWPECEIKYTSDDVVIASVAPRYQRTPP